MTASALKISPPTSAGPMRFVLPPDAPLLANLAALWAVNAELAAALEALGDDAAYPIETAKNGQPTLALPTADGQKIYLHSRFQPREEARKLIDPLLGKNKLIYHLLGLGLGHHLAALRESVGEETILCVFEPDLRMIWTAFCAIDFSDLMRGRRLMILWKEDKSDIFSNLTPQSALISLGAQVVTHGPSVKLRPRFFQQVEVWLDELASFIRTGMNTLVLNSAKTAENIAANIGWYAASPSSSRLNGRYQKQPAVIVSAGPSLRKNKHLLAGLNDRAVLIAVQTTLQPLLEMGVEPQFVTSLDYHEICSRFFEKLPPNIQTELVVEPKATDAIFRLFDGPLTVLGNEFAESLLREVALQKPILPAGATVAHLSYYLAQYMGCDPIIFVGQDLAFTDGLCYAPGTSYEDVWRPELSRYCTLEMKQWEQIVREKYILRKVPDQQGNPIYTEERLFMYLQQFERDFGKSRATIIDATEGGAAKRGAIAMPLKEAIEKYCREPLQPLPQDHPGLNWEKIPQCLSSLAKRREEAQEIARISRQTLPLLEEIRDHLRDQGRVNRVIARVDQLRARMSELGRTYDQVTQLTQQTELDRFRRDRQVAASKTSGAIRQRLQVERDIENVHAMITAAEAFAKLMDQTIAKLEVQMAQRPVLLAA
jgi:hypothetical protein